MLPEALVILACATSKGCQETSSYYYDTHPEVRKLVEQNEKIVTDFIGPRVVETVGPALYVVAGGTGVVRLTRRYSLQFKRDEATLVFRVEF